MPDRWRKARGTELAKAEEFLREREKFCVAACAKFIRLKKGGHVWKLGEGWDKPLLIHSGRILYPVFDKEPRLPLPRFLRRFLLRTPIHSVQGAAADVETLTDGMERAGYFVDSLVDYELMGLEGEPGYRALAAGPAGLEVRPAAEADFACLTGLQAAYEREEVYVKERPLDEDRSRLNLRHIFRCEKIFVACLGGRVVGKVNTTAESWTRYQIGGVYVEPSYRGLGIARRLVAEFILNIQDAGRGITLFVRKKNPAAKKAYAAAGFKSVADYRISYILED